MVQMWECRHFCEPRCTQTLCVTVDHLIRADGVFGRISLPDTSNAPKFSVWAQNLYPVCFSGSTYFCFHVFLLRLCSAAIMTAAATWDRMFASICASEQDGLTWLPERFSSSIQKSFTLWLRPVSTITYFPFNFYRSVHTGLLAS